MPRITITEPEKSPQPYLFDLETDSVKLGRADGNEIVLECGSISGTHAEMVRVPGGFELRDLGSTNGMTKGDETIESWLLSDGDELLLGDVGFAFRLSEEEAVELAGELDTAGEPDAPKLPAMPLPMPDLSPADPPVAPLPAPVRRQAAPVHAGGGVSGWWFVLAFLILGSIAFYMGLSMRHKNEVGVTLGQVFMKRLSTPDVSRITAITGEDPKDVFIQANGDPEEEEIEVVTPIEPEPVPVEIEGWEDRERPEGWEEEQERGDTGIEALLEPGESDDEEEGSGDGRDDLEDIEGEDDAFREREPIGEDDE